MGLAQAPEIFLSERYRTHALLSFATGAAPGRTLYQLARQRAFAPHDFDCGNRLDLQQKHGIVGECECGKVAAVEYINSLRYARG